MKNRGQPFQNPAVALPRAASPPSLIGDGSQSSAAKIIGCGLLLRALLALKELELVACSMGTSNEEQRSRGTTRPQLVYSRRKAPVQAQSSSSSPIQTEKYTLYLLEETGKLGCKPVETPIEVNHKLGDTMEDAAVDRSSYQRLVYPSNTPGRGILFKRGGNLTLEAYTDADYAGSVVDRRSTSGYCTFLGGNLVTWRSKKQNVVARSSVEVEFRAMSLGICELLWLKIILEDLKIKWEGPLKLYCGNKSTINIAYNPVQHDRTKHVEVDRQFIKEKLYNGLICTPYVSTVDQVVDILTKGLPGKLFQTFAGKLKMKTSTLQLEGEILERRNHLLSQIEEVRRTRSVQRAARKKRGGLDGQGLSTVAVVGYTNAGKSTLISALSDSDLYSDARLFATLDARLKSVVLPSGRKVLLSDTVGFISDLPVQLVEAFHSTLEEVLEADLLVHVIDCTAPNRDEHRSTVLQVLQQIGVSEEKLQNMIEAWNKIDYEEEMGDAEDVEIGDFSGAEDGETEGSPEEDFDVASELLDEKSVDGSDLLNDDKQGDYSEGWLLSEDESADDYWNTLNDQKQAETSNDRKALKDSEAEPQHVPHVKVSALTGVGLQQLLELIDEKLKVQDEQMKSEKVVGSSFVDRKWRPPRKEEVAVEQSTRKPMIRLTIMREIEDSTTAFGRPSSRRWRKTTMPSLGKYLIIFACGLENVQQCYEARAFIVGSLVDGEAWLAVADVSVGASDFMEACAENTGPEKGGMGMCSSSLKALNITRVIVSYKASVAVAALVSGFRIEWSLFQWSADVLLLVGMLFGFIPLLLVLPLISFGCLVGDGALERGCCGRSITISCVCKMGQTQLQWMVIRNMYGKFCDQVSEGIAVALLVCIIMVVQSCISAFGVFRLYGGNKAKKSGWLKFGCQYEFLCFTFIGLCMIVVASFGCPASFRFS
ncbi:GTP-binding protein [Hibiscus syriacus]|uniref:GTP-binding protein n=1 Tax=Hibiscus syriacus TaxID=106335 RepID=A0A6A3C8R6_HIBSY|nr:GTP-binding protein [Hibiscus syriacus]